MPASQKNKSASYYIEGVLSGDIAILSRAITIIESQNSAHQSLALDIIDGIVSSSGRSFRLGVTGVPGVGKSTFIESFGLELIRRGSRLAVLAIDPTGVRSKGSILGDKTRMETLSVHPQAYIRPSPSGGALGGLTRVTYESMLLCEAAGFDYIIIETVGVGQSEIAVSRISDFFLLLMLSGAGDELQGVKRGIMEMADALVVTKADGSNTDKAKAACAEYRRALHLMQPPESGWGPKAETCSAINGTGIAAIADMTEQYRRHAETSGYFQKRRNDQREQIFREALHSEVIKRFYIKHDVESSIRKLRDSQVFNPFREVRALLDRNKP